MDKVLFREEQKFREWWQIILILGSTVPTMIIIIYTLIQMYVKGVQVGNTQQPVAVLVLTFCAMLIALWVYFSLKLDIWITKDGINFRFYPLIYKNKFISKEEIQRFEIREYKANREYGGRGIRRGFGRKWGRGYIVSGNTGLQLYLTNGKKVLFGTQRSQSIIYAMHEMMKDQ
jgi:hypothetical protein